MLQATIINSLPPPHLRPRRLWPAPGFELEMRSDAFLTVILALGLSVIAQTLTVTTPNGPTVVQVWTTVNGFPARTNVATLSGSTTPTSIPSSQITSSQATNTRSPAGPPTSSSTTKTGSKGVPTGTVVGVIIAVLFVLVALALTLFFLKRRKAQRRRRRLSFEIDPVVASPVVDKTLIPDPFITDEQAIGMGFDLSRQTTRRVDAKFLFADERMSSETLKHRATPPLPPAPSILVTREGEATGRPITPSSSGHHRPQSLADHAQNTQHSSDIKSASGPTGATAPREMFPPSRRERSSSSSSPDVSSSQQDISRRMRRLLSEMENHMAMPSTRNSNVVLQLQQQIEMLRRENEELRLVGSEAPPAYEHGSGRF